MKDKVISVYQNQISVLNILDIFQPIIVEKLQNTKDFISTIAKLSDDFFIVGLVNGQFQLRSLSQPSFQQIFDSPLYNCDWR
ncbi:UNKNOWN [Stylonychia lemnae]|uniref:Uncharacterized protein n=1 Tax=Stylonychia lemnae TaxID=5949 RepID=A0A077ZY37_STYLE|nr:UNKNOWN [Stylonychia lemnae]|eukprot:CDW74537.1 UNKNOWN [Stylonychia lemnae]